MNKFRRLFRKSMRSKWSQVYIGLFCTLFIFFAYTMQLPLVSFLINRLDKRIYDQLVQLNQRPHSANPPVVIIDIDNLSVQKEGRWPWPRNKMAELINKLKKAGVVTIGMDIVMAEPEMNYALGLQDEINTFPRQEAWQQQLNSLLGKIAPDVDNDKIFAHSLLDHNVILGFLFHNDRTIRKGELPPPIKAPNNQYLSPGDLPLLQFRGYNGCLPLFLQASNLAGAVTNLPDADGSVRHGLLLARYKDKLYPSLALATAMNYLLIDHAELKISEGQLYGVQLGAIFVPTTPEGQILIPFWGAPGTLPYFSATEVLHDEVNPQSLQGTIAIIGSSLILLADLHQSPMAQGFPGVEMVGNMVQGIIGQQLVTPFNWNNTTGRIYFLLTGLYLTALFSFVGATGMLLLAAFSIIVVLGITFYLFVYQSLYVALASVLILIILLTILNYGRLFRMEKRQKKKINQLFGQYVPQEYVKELIESPEQYSMEGEERNMTVLFSDIRDFTSVSENLVASEVKRLLNRFFTPITEIIFSFRGTVDKYVGDMIVAFWGAPMHDEKHASHAVECALEMMKRLPEINNAMIKEGLPAVNIGIGLATGLMNVGDMGSEFRRAYTVLGDTVNLASRLQDLTKFYHVNILVSDGTRLGMDEFVWRAVDKITVKGRKTGLTIFQPLGKLNDCSVDQLEELKTYHHALEEYYAQRWDSALNLFSSLKQHNPDVYLYELYLKRVHEFTQSPPPPNWDGIFIHTHK